MVPSLHHQIFVECLLMPGYVLGTENPAMTLSNKQKEVGDNQISKIINAMKVGAFSLPSGQGRALLSSTQWPLKTHLLTEQINNIICTLS